MLVPIYILRRREKMLGFVAHDGGGDNLGGAERPRRYVGHVVLRGGGGPVLEKR